MIRLKALRNIRHSCGTIHAGQSFETSDEMAQRYVARGIAITEDGRWKELDWPDSEVVVLGSGPSLTLAQVEMVETWRKAADNRRVIAVNTTFRMAPFADVLYAGDKRWWQVNKFHLESFSGEKWSGAIGAQLFGAKYIHSETGTGLGIHPGVIRLGRNSGYQAINLAFHAGAKKIILLGFDCRSIDGITHWHGEHPYPLNLTQDYAEWRIAFARMAADFKKTKTEVINCTPDSALTCFSIQPLAEVLGVQVAAVGVLGWLSGNGDVADEPVEVHQGNGGAGVDQSSGDDGAVRTLGEDLDVGRLPDTSGSGVSEGRFHQWLEEGRLPDLGARQPNEQ